MNRTVASEGQSAAELISNSIEGLADWRGKTLGRCGS